MARIRSIKPEFFTSETIANLAIEARLLFIGLWTIADDQGALLDSPRQILGNVFPRDETIAEEHVAEWLNEIADEKLIIRAHVNNRHVIVVRCWFEHQLISHPGKKTILTVEETKAIRTGKINQHSGDIPETFRRLSGDIPDRSRKGKGNRIRNKALCDPGGSAQHTKNASPSLKVNQLEGFTRFWEAFGDKRGKAQAAASWHNLKPDGETAESIISGAFRYAKEREKILDRNGTPKMAQGWLTDRRWEDESTPESQTRPGEFQAPTVTPTPAGLGDEKLPF